MRGFLRSVSLIVIILSTLAILASSLLSALSADKTPVIIYIGAGLGTILSAGILWVLIEIADAVTAKPDPRQIGLTGAQKELLYVGRGRAG